MNACIECHHQSTGHVSEGGIPPTDCPCCNRVLTPTAAPLFDLTPGDAT